MSEHDALLEIRTLADLDQNVCGLTSHDRLTAIWCLAEAALKQQEAVKTEGDEFCQAAKRERAPECAIQCFLCQPVPKVQCYEIPEMPELATRNESEPVDLRGWVE